MKSKIIKEGENLHHLFIKGMDVWLTNEEISDLAYDLKTYALIHQIDKL